MWEQLDLAERDGAVIPPIEVYRVGDLHFVKDGRHRVSVAIATGQEMIDADARGAGTAEPGSFRSQAPAQPWAPRFPTPPTPFASITPPAPPRTPPPPAQCSTGPDGSGPMFHRAGLAGGNPGVMLRVGGTPA